MRVATSGGAALQRGLDGRPPYRRMVGGVGDDLVGAWHAGQAESPPEIASREIGRPVRQAPCQGVDAQPVYLHPRLARAGLAGEPVPEPTCPSM